MVGRSTFVNRCVEVTLQDKLPESPRGIGTNFLGSKRCSRAFSGRRGRNLPQRKNPTRPRRLLRSQRSIWTWRLKKYPLPLPRKQREHLPPLRNPIPNQLDRLSGRNLLHPPPPRLTDLHPPLRRDRQRNRRLLLNLHRRSSRRFSLHHRNSQARNRIHLDYHNRQTKLSNSTSKILHQHQPNNPHNWMILSG